MRIEYLELRNFASIYTAMKKKTIKIDFSKSKHNVILLVGKNGTGKTSILSTLHPFAYQGNMDVRSTTKLILDGEDGYKEIHIRKGIDVYVIRHIYKYTKNGYQVKSYITKNGNDLNPNGNVTSFNEVVEVELSIQQDYLKLLRLGSNVTNIIEMKAAERKSFTSDLLSDINIYTTLYKKINDDNRLLKGMINSITSKMDRLAVSDVDDLIEDIGTIEDEIKGYEYTIGDLQRQEGAAKGVIKTLFPDADSEFNPEEQLHELESKRTRILADQESIMSQMSSNSNCQNLSIEDLTTSMAKLNAEIDGLKDMIKRYTDFLDEKYTSKSNLSSRLAVLTSDEDYEEVKNAIDKLNHKVSMMESNGVSKPKYSKDVLLGFINSLQTLWCTMEELYHYSLNSIKTCVNMVFAGEDIHNYVSSQVASIDKRLANMRAKTKASVMGDVCLVLFRPPSCPDDTCPYLSLYNDFFNVASPTENSVAELEAERAKLLDMGDIADSIKYIIRTCAAIYPKDLDIISTEKVLRIMLVGGTLDGIEREFTDMIAEAELYDEYIEAKDSLKDLQLALSKMNANSGEIESIKRDIVSLDKAISELTNDIQAAKDVIIEKSSTVEFLEQMIDMRRKYEEYRREYDNNAQKLDALENEITSLKEKISAVRQSIEQIKIIGESIRNATTTLDNLKKSLFNKRYVLKEYETLCAERDTLNDKYDDISIIRESLSSTKGIPLLFIQLYLKNTRQFVNHLLSSVYEDFEIEDFEITASEFNIPYVKNGIRVSDVVYASQGERSFLSLALSFALINQSIKDYNILLLDEIDSTLDIRNRSMFLNILTQQMESIASEQVFLITHNNMFDSYPVDIIMTSDVEIDSYTNANIIYK